MAHNHLGRLQPSRCRLRAEPPRAVEHSDRTGIAPSHLAQDRPTLVSLWHSRPVLYIPDHGSDFTSRHLEQMAAELHIALGFSIVGKPRGRGKVERIFETINQLFLCHQPGYTPAGSSPAKPA